MLHPLVGPPSASSQRGAAVSSQRKAVTPSDALLGSAMQRTGSDCAGRPLTTALQKLCRQVETLSQRMLCCVLGDDEHRRFHALAAA